MPDLGIYATTVISAYAVTLVLIGLLVGISLLRARRLRDTLVDLESRRGKKNG